jgi:hypothetical protein
MVVPLIACALPFEEIPETRACSGGSGRLEKSSHSAEPEQVVSELKSNDFIVAGSQRRAVFDDIENKRHGSIFSSSRAC